MKHLSDTLYTGPMSLFIKFLEGPSPSPEGGEEVGCARRLTSDNRFRVALKTGTQACWRGLAILAKNDSEDAGEHGSCSSAADPCGDNFHTGSTSRTVP